MKWFKLYADLQGHPKRWRFEELADTEYGLHYLTAWFSYVCKFAPDGDVTKFTPKQVARACEWKGDADVFWAALIGAGFIEKHGENYVAHDWHEENGRFIKENEKRKQPTGDPRVSQGLPLRQDRTGQDRTGQTPPTAAVAASAPVVKAPKGDHPGFDLFWAEYPKSRRVKKNAALKAWNTKKPPVYECVETLKWQKKGWDWTKDDGKWIPHPSTWINAGQWMDENPDKRVSAPAVIQKPLCPHEDITTKKRIGLKDGEKAIFLTDACACGHKFEEIGYTKQDLENQIKMLPDFEAPKQLLIELEKGEA